MLKQKNRLYTLTLIPVALICLGAVALSTRALFENLRFVSATNDLSTVVTSVRSYAKEQRSYSFIPGEDILTKMIALGQMPAKVRANPWDGALSAFVAPDMGLRIETDLPAHACRRIALYLFGRKPADLGLMSMEARSEPKPAWSSIYPVQGIDTGLAAQNACGKSGHAHLALVFKIRE